MSDSEFSEFRPVRKESPDPGDSEHIPIEVSPIIIPEPETPTAKEPVQAAAKEEHQPYIVPPQSRKPDTQQPNVSPKKPRKPLLKCWDPIGCCLGSCFGIVFILVVMTTIAVVFPTKLSSLANTILYPDLSTPDVGTEKTEEIRSMLNTVTGVESSTQNLTKEQCNQFLGTTIANDRSAVEKMWVEFTEREGHIYIQTSQAAPWIHLVFAENDDASIPETELFVGPFSMNFLKKPILENIFPHNDPPLFLDNQLQTDVLFATIFFGENPQRIQIESISFGNNSIQIITKGAE